MHGSRRWSRAFAGALTVWFSLVMAAPAVLHSCPSAVAAAAAAESAAGDHASHRAHQAPAHDDGAPVDCRCLGSCALTAPVVLPTGGAVLPASAPVILEAAAPYADHSVIIAPLDHLRPFATAPPLVLG